MPKTEPLKHDCHFILVYRDRYGTVYFCKCGRTHMTRS
jgi:hypothetical protein